MACLDTSFVIDIIRNNEDAVLKKESLEKMHEPLMIASPTIIELIRGFKSSKISEMQKDKINQFLNSISTFPLDKESAIAAGNMEVELIKKGKQIDITDIMIAAIAKTNNEKVITRNVKHFGRIKGVEVEGY